MTGAIEITQRGIISLKGPDAIRYLNGQLTNDVSVDLSSKVIPACLCTIKGKVEALVWVTAGEVEELTIECHSEGVEDVFNRLDRYLIADDCELVIVDDVAPLVHVVSDVSKPGSKECWRFGVKGFDCLQGSGGDEDSISLDRLEIESLLKGIPVNSCEINGESFPSELGLDKWAVDFHKGCYLGQEIVSRLESVGKAKNQWQLFKTDKAFTKGDVLLSDSGKTVATITRDSISWQGSYLTSIVGKLGFGSEGFEMVNQSLPAKW